MTIFRLDTRKTIEAAATLLRLAPYRRMSRKRLLALLYLADRESLKPTGRPIIGGRLVAMDYGPIHSEVYDFIKGGIRNRPSGRATLKMKITSSSWPKTSEPPRFCATRSES